MIFPLVAACDCKETDFIDQFQDQLNGFTIQPGTFSFFNLSSCEHDTTGCYFQNPSSRYGLIELPPHPKEKEHKNTPKGAFLGGGWRLAADEVIVMYGCTPPESQYFGWTPYVTYKYTGKLLFPWRLIFGSLGDTLNHHRTQTQCGSAFNTNALYLISGSQTSIQAVTDVVQEIAPNLPINVISFPANDPEWQLKMGIQDTDDLFLMLLRITFPRDKQAYENYVNSKPFKVLRLTPSLLQSSHPILFGAPNLISRTLSNDESHLEEAHKFLVDRVIDVHGQVLKEQLTVKEKFLLQSMAVAPLEIVGADYGLGCYQKAIPCFGDNRDTSYVVTLPPFRFNNDEEMVFFVGVDDKAAGVAEYTSGSLYHLGKQLGIADFNNFNFNGSSKAYLKGTAFEAYADYLYVYSFAYNCHEKDFCTEIPSSGFPSLPLGNWAVMIARAYVSETGVGPDSKILVKPRQLKFLQPKLPKLQARLK